MTLKVTRRTRRERSKSGGDSMKATQPTTITSKILKFHRDGAKNFKANVLLSTPVFKPLEVPESTETFGSRAGQYKPRFPALARVYDKRGGTYTLWFARLPERVNLASWSA